MRKLRFLVALAAACFCTPFAAHAQPLTIIRVGSTADDQVTPVLYAQRTGRFRAAGLDVRIVRMSGGDAIAEAVAAGTLEIGKSSLIVLLQAHEEGVPFKLIAAGGISKLSPSYGLLIVAKDSPITTARDLNGKIVSAAPRALDRLATQAWVDQNGGDSKTLKFLALPQAEHVDAIVQRLADAAVTVHPQVDAALASGKIRALANPYPAIAPQYLVSAWFLTTTWANAHRDAALAFARVVRQTATYTNAHRAETAQMVSDFSKIPLAVVRGMQRAEAGTTLTPTFVQPVIDTAVRYKALHRSFPASEMIFAGL